MSTNLPAATGHVVYRFRHDPYSLQLFVPQYSCLSALPCDEPEAHCATPNSAQNDSATPGATPSDTASSAGSGSKTSALPDAVANHYKTRMCKNFMATGHCSYEGFCRFAHGSEDMHSYAENQRRGLTSEKAVRRFQRRRRGCPSEAGALDGVQ